MPNPGFTRRQFVGAAAFTAAMPAIASNSATTTSVQVPRTAEAASGEATLILRPTRVFKVKDRSHEKTESWIVSIAVQTPGPATLEPVALDVELARDDLVLRHAHYGVEAFAAMTYRSSFPPKLADGREPPTPLHWPLFLRLRHTEPVAFGTNRMTVSATLKDEHGRAIAARAIVPIETYVPSTSLVFPFKGKGVVLQAGAANGGHRNRSGQFALDAMGVDAAWSVCAPGDGKKNSDYPGWRRDLIAPAAGVVVALRSDRPDQPVGDTSDPAYFAPEYRALGGGDPGNHLVIDHGHGEFSMIAHFMAGTLRVAKGDRVAQGQVLGKLGHSGDTDAPHVHYQLQSGPDWENADALPCRFANVGEDTLDRGTYFEAR